MAVRNIRKQLAGVEDLLLGKGKQDQERSAGIVSITKIDIPAIVETIDELSLVDINKYTTAIVKDIDRGGTFIYIASNLAINNGGTIFNGWTRQYDGIPKAKWFTTKEQAWEYYTNNTGQATNTYLATNIVIGDKDLPHTASTRDAYQVSRFIDGKTDCHGFADKTDLRTVTDYGGYGVFDNTVKVGGNHLHNHIFGFQDRTEYYGSGTLEHMSGLYSAPTLSGSGAIDLRTGAVIYDLAKTGTGTLTEQIGIYIKNLVGGVRNSAITIDQDNSGYSMYAPNGGKWFIRGNVDQEGKLGLAGQININTLPSASAIALKTNITDSASIFADTVTNTGFLGTSGNYELHFVVNAAARLKVRNSVETYNIVPGYDNSQYLGDALNRWKQLYAGTTVIATSDDREKTYLDITEVEKQVALELKASMKKFKFNDAIIEKGENKARIHFGASAQTVKSIFEKYGLVAEDYAILCYDEWEEQEEIKDNNGVILQEYRPAGNRYGLRYEELLSFIIGAL